MPGVSAAASHGALPGEAPENEDRADTKMLCVIPKDLSDFSLVWVTSRPGA